MTKIIGILNYTSNSFSDGGNYNNIHSAVARVNELFLQGADIIDIGASATSYGAELHTSSEEFGYLKPLLEKINLNNISIDTYHYETMKYVIELGVTYINDVSGGKNPRVLELIAKNPNVHYICMYSLTLPADKKIRVKSINEIYDWFGNKVDECVKYGIPDNRIIIDPGIGFVTDANQSIKLLKNIAVLQRFGVKICIGHSRKSFFEKIAKYPVEERDIETVAASLYMLLKSVDYVRVHNVEMHKRAFRVFSKLLN
jgi:dihydropteroate synthase